MATRIYCSKCKDAYSERISRSKFSTEVFRRVAVEARINAAVYGCVCENCAHRWNTRSAEAAELWSPRTAI